MTSMCPKKFTSNWPPPLGHGEGFDRSVDGDAGVVNEGTQWPPVGLDKRGKVGDLFWLGDVEDDGADVGGLEGAPVALAAHSGDDGVALRGKRASSGGPHPGGGSGHDDEGRFFR